MWNSKKKWKKGKRTLFQSRTHCNSNWIIRSREEQLQNQLLDLQKELRDKSAKLSNAQKNADTAEAMLAAVKENHTALLEQTTLLVRQPWQYRMIA